MSKHELGGDGAGGLTHEDFERIVLLTKARAAIALDADRMPLVEARLVALARRENFRSLGHLLGELWARGEGSDLARKVVEAMTTHETAFFRDFHPFETLRTLIIPDRLVALRGERPLHIWCGAASSGQEPYSVAMLMQTHFPGVAARIVATDVSQSVLTRCQKGRYSSLEVNRGLPARMLVDYFGEAGIEWQLEERIMSGIETAPLNLAGEWPEWPQFDIVLMRHVLIYFDKATRERVLRRVHARMAPDGYLLLGSGESAAALPECFKQEQHGRTICYRMSQQPKGECP